jgi:hypothetical protein
MIVPEVMPVLDKQEISSLALSTACAAERAGAVDPTNS